MIHGSMAIFLPLAKKNTKKRPRLSRESSLNWLSGCFGGVWRGMKTADEEICQSAAQPSIMKKWLN